MMENAFEVITTVGIDEQALANVNVYPNPASEYLNIGLDQDDADQYELKIWDLSGKMVYSDVSTNKRIDISNFQTGIYHLTISGKGNTHTIKFIKN